jgi:hypothetical protein
MNQTGYLKKNERGSAWTAARKADIKGKTCC